MAKTVTDSTFAPEACYTSMIEEAVHALADMPHVEPEWRDAIVRTAFGASEVLAHLYHEAKLAALLDRAVGSGRPVILSKGLSKS